MCNKTCRYVYANSYVALAAVWSLDENVHPLTLKAEKNNKNDMFSKIRVSRVG